MVHNRHQMRIHQILALAIALGLVGCYTAPTVTKKDMATSVTEATSFIEDGKTSREAMLLKLGIPSRQFESGRILAWRVRTAEEGLVMVSDYPGGYDPRFNTWPASSRGYDLIVVFDAGDLVQTHNLVPARR
jgi:hypothetical protein